ncbi:MAG: hypothetical protein IJX98_05255 [Clostridia bacterium]|nr:hypothetical protein [Clostridia bacterium]
MSGRKYRRKKYNAWIGFALFCVRRCTKKRKVEGELPQAPCVYLCRHRDNDGVIGAFTSLRTVLRPWVLHTFTDYQTAKKHLQEYTFSKRLGYGKLFCKLASPIVARVLTSLSKSARAIPVYRGETGMRSITTLKRTVEALQAGDNILIFPDVDYANENDQAGGEVYQGFVAVDRLYYKKCGKRVQFVPVYMTKEKTVVHEPIEFTGENDAETLKKIVDGIYKA